MEDLHLFKKRCSKTKKRNKMNVNFFNIQVDSQLICNFLAIFSRIEYSLKATIKYADDRETKVDPSWDRFANEIHEKFLQIEDIELKSAVDYLVNNSPKKQILDDNKLIFQEQEIDQNQKLTQQILLMVRTVRNNLFHGGKYHSNAEGRDALLIKHSLKVLSECAKIDEDVYRFYGSY
jgi:hypothetical protein